MCALQAQLAEATEKADEAKSQVDKLETNLQETSRGTLQCCCSWLHVATTLEIQTRTPHRDFAFFSLSRSSLVLFVSANKELTQQYQELKAENLKQQKEAKTLQEELDKQVDKAAEASAAAKASPPGWERAARRHPALAALFKTASLRGTCMRARVRTASTC